MSTRCPRLNGVPGARIWTRRTIGTCVRSWRGRGVDAVLNDRTVENTPNVGGVTATGDRERDRLLVLRLRPCSGICDAIPGVRENVVLADRHGSYEVPVDSEVVVAPDTREGRRCRKS